MSEENRHSEMGHLPPIVPRYNYDLLNSLDDIYLEEIRDDHQWPSPRLHLLENDEIAEEINEEFEFPAVSATSENFLASSIRNDTWNCPICLDIFEDPVETPCCHNLFCSMCIEPVVKCPICKKLLLRCLPNIPIKRLIQELSVKCRHPLCDKIVRKAFLVKHESICENALVKCSYSEYCEEIIRKDLDNHLTQFCPFRPIHCLLGCPAVLAYIELEEHISAVCPNALLNCPQECGANLQRKEIPLHFTQFCPNTSVLCPLSDYFGTVCAAQCLRKDLEEHKLTCNYRQVRCGNIGCKEKVMYQYLQDHDDLCQYKPIQCLNNCGAELLRKKLKKHKGVCELEIIECTYKIVGCAEKLMRKKFEEHLKEVAKDHEAMMLKTYSKHAEMIKKLENEMQEFRYKTSDELSQIKNLLKSQRNLYHDFNADEDMPNPFGEILKQ